MWFFKKIINYSYFLGIIIGWFCLDDVLSTSFFNFFRHQSKYIICIFWHHSVVNLPLRRLKCVFFFNIFGHQCCVILTNNYQRTTLVVGTVGAKRNAKPGVWGGRVIWRLFVVKKCDQKMWSKIVNKKCNQKMWSSN